jgi:hypothetical protein
MRFLHIPTRITKTKRRLITQNVDETVELLELFHAAGGNVKQFGKGMALFFIELNIFLQSCNPAILLSDRMKTCLPKICVRIFIIALVIIPQWEGPRCVSTRECINKLTKSCKEKMFSN